MSHPGRLDRLTGMAQHTHTLQPLTRPDWLTQEAWPFDIHTLHLTQGRVAYTDVGTGPVLLLVHAGMWSFVWRDLITRLGTQFRVIAFDPPACGLSDGGAGAGIVQAARVVDALVTGLDLRDVTLVVHDLGGPAALHAAHSWTERVRGIVVLNAFGWRPTGPVFRGMLRLLGSAIMREFDAWTGWLPWAASTRFGVGRHLTRADRKTFRRGMRRRGRRSMHHLLRSALRHDWTAVEAAVGRLAARPALTIFGQWNDPLKMQPRWRALIPDLEQRVLPRGNHFPMCDAPDQVAHWITHWHGHQARAAAENPDRAVSAGN
jgi:pimeloyl-ACP methyl ester carboxylesterase